MKVVDLASVRYFATQSLFPFVKDPFYVATDFPWMAGHANWNYQGLVVADYELEAAYPSPVWVPHDQTTAGYVLGDCGGGALPLVDWQPLGGTSLQFRCCQPIGFNEIYVSSTQATADGAILNAYAPLACQGFLFAWSEYQQNYGYSGYTDSVPYLTLWVTIGTGLNQRQYIVTFNSGRCTIGIQDDVGSILPPREVQMMPATGDVWAALHGLADPAEVGPGSGDPTLEPTTLAESYNTLECRFVAGRISFRVNGQAPAIVFDEDRYDESGDPLYQIVKVEVRATQFVRLACSLHPMKFAPAAFYRSAEIPIGFSSSTWLVPDVIPAGHVPPGWDAQVDIGRSNLSGPIIDYQLDWFGPIEGAYRGLDYANSVAAVRAVNIPYRGVVLGGSAVGAPANPEILEVSHQFDPNTFEIVSSMAATYSNNQPKTLPTGEFGTWAYWSRVRGQVGATVELSRTTAAGGIGTPVKVFTGYSNSRAETVGSAGDSRHTIFGQGRTCQLRPPAFALPWFDGWNVFYAIAYLAQLRGVDLSQMAFSPFIPPNPYVDLGDEDGQPAYFLPVGSSGSVLTRFSGSSVYEVMLKIAYSIGYTLHFDANGFLQFRKFRVPLGVKRDFFESDRASALSGSSGYGGLAGLEGVTVARSIKDMDRVRSETIVVGVDAFAPKYAPTVVKYSDDAVWADPLAFNHLGYRSPAVWVDTQFSDATYAARAAFALQTFLRVPSYEHTMTTWLQPDLFPLDVVRFQSARFGADWTRLLVTSVTHRLSQESGSTTFVASYIDNFQP